MANPDWVRDEVILALEVYLSDKSSAGNKLHPKVIELSNFLNNLPIFPKEIRDSTFRNINGVAMKLSNFLRLDPEYSGVGLKAGGNLEKEVWNEFYTDRPRLLKTVESIHKFYHELESSSVSLFDDENFEAPEGRILTAIHKIRERSKTLIQKKKSDVIKKTGKLECEACGFVFSQIYGPIGNGFIECHHDIPVSSLSEHSTTSIKDLRLLCSNCHSMIHSRKPWLTVPELRKIIDNVSI
jgi:5-methylcytosine-specific restriction protein A